MFVLSGITNVSAVEPRASLFEESKVYNLNVYNSSGTKIGNFKTTCTAQIREINGSFSMDSYTLSAPTQKIGSTKVTATVVKKSISGMKITVTWKVKAEFASIPPKIVYSEQSAVYNFN